ncbi:30S ribosomal protein S6 [Gammaproteobacteria bacterium]|nr:30S ribosomal protein S6 [Gammaproteobacteria bacterium]MDA9153949.1 30S ribosomal protein S6 [Gammaproteobacteria bacterium]MDA9371234.1 30S ribosomal protein S6 [Gammaproteobacteria bacterium]MDC1525337.1 30S ribosomal protein S6 [Gammaproteobacteria bacterium]|tara:strand:- start:316 stop:753 length:438 start_codon:yes stop_codon:yes gene_type:complete
MNNYELTLILNPDLSSKFDEFEVKFSKVLSDIGFETKKLENIGRRQLAYSILNHNKGHYAIYQLEGPAAGAIELETKLKYDTSVIRHLMLKVDTLSLEDSLLMIESREAKKAPEEIKVTPPKAKVTPEIKPKEDSVEEPKTTETE